MQRSPHRFLASSAGALVLAAAFSCTALPSMALAAELGDYPIFMDFNPGAATINATAY
eukprot:gene37151-45831_t